MLAADHTSDAFALTTASSIGAEDPAPAGRTTARSLHVDSRVLMRALVASMLVVLGLHLTAVAFYLQGLDFKGSTRLYMDNEGNLPAYFSTFIIFLAAVLLTIIAAFKRAERARFARHWTVLGLMFFGLALDEALSFHEILIEPLRNAFGLSGLMRFSWVLVGGVLAAGVAIAYLPFVAHLPQPTRRLFVAAGLIYVLGALGFEMLSGPLYEAYEAGASPGPYMAMMTVEETLEMTGILLFIHALLGYLEAFRPEFSVRLDSA